MTYARVILDSISPQGDRLTTVEVRFHRFVLSEFNTHRMFSRNSASSRAIPVEKQLARLEEDPAWPVAWASEQPGMQGGTELTGRDLADAQKLFADVHKYTVKRIKKYLKKHPDKSKRLHKSLVNRLIEPFMWHTVIVTSTTAGWENFFKLRCSPLAQPEIRVAAEQIRVAYDNSVPTPLKYNEWHLPYVTTDIELDGYDLEERKAISAARCARVSYLTHDGKRDPNEDIAMYERLTSAEPPHDSPMEHVATPKKKADHALGNFEGWHQLRHLR